MAKKRHMIRGILMVAAGAAVGCLVYRHQDLLLGFFRELTAPAAASPGTRAEVIGFASPAPGEADIVIDRTQAPETRLGEG